MDDLTPRSLHLFIGAIKKKIFDFDIKGAQVFFFFFFSFLMRMKMLLDGAFLPNKTFQFNQIIELNGG